MFSEARFYRGQGTVFVTYVTVVCAQWHSDPITTFRLESGSGRTPQPSGNLSWRKVTVICEPDHSVCQA